MRGDGARPRVDDDVVHGDGGQVLAPDRRPASASIPAHPERPLRPHEEDVGVLRVLPDHADGGSFGQVARDGLPRLAVVGREEDKGDVNVFHVLARVVYKFTNRVGR